MRILHLSSVYAPHLVGGAERVVEQLAEETARAGHTVAVAYLVPDAAEAGSRNGVQTFPLAHRNPLWIEDSANHSGPVRQLNKLCTLFNFATASDLSRLVASFKPEIVHSHSMVELTPLMWAEAAKSGARVVHTLHDYDLLCIRAALFKDGVPCASRHVACRAASMVKRHYHRHISAAVAVSGSVMKTHLDAGFFGHLGPDRRHVVWNPVKTELAAEDDTVRATGDDVFVFGFLGRLVPEKGLAVLIDACRLLPKSGWKLIVGGKAPGDRNPYAALADGLPIEFAGFVDTRTFFAAIDTLVVPSLWREPFGLTVVEAYRASVPVIASSIGGLTELVSSVDPSGLVPPNDPASLATRMNEAMARGRGAGPPRAPVVQLLSRVAPREVAAKYTHIYRTLIEMSGAAPVDEKTGPGGNS